MLKYAPKGSYMYYAPKFSNAQMSGKLALGPSLGVMTIDYEIINWTNQLGQSVPFQAIKTKPRCIDVNLTLPWQYTVERNFGSL
jgi:hypothetical protein